MSDTTIDTILSLAEGQQGDPPGGTSSPPPPPPPQVMAGGLLVAAAALTAAGLWYWRSQRPSGDAIYYFPFGGRRCKVYLVTELSQLEVALDALEKELKDVKVLGFDAEWKPAKRPDLALLQISSATVIVLLRLSVLPTLGDRLYEILSDESIWKCGVGIQGDARLLASQYDCVMSGCVELGAIAADWGFAKTSLKSLSYDVLGVKLNKARHLQCGNWEAPVLSRAQVRYAALDAWVGYEILFQLHQQQAAFTSLADFALSAIDIPWKPKSKKQIQKLIDGLPQSSSSSSSSNKNKKRKKYHHLDRDGIPYGETKEERIASTPVKKKELYYNCKMLAPDGAHIASIDEKKVQWYLDRDLAVLVSKNEQETVIRLLIEPKGRGNQDDRFALGPFINRCVVCGKGENYMKHSVVPPSFRRLLPLRVKSHAFHDIVLLCRGCSRKCNTHSENFRSKLFREVGIRPKMNEKLTHEARAINRIVSAAHSLLNYTIPPERQILQRKFLGLSEDLSVEIPREVLQDLANRRAEKVEIFKAAEKQYAEKHLVTEEQVVTFVKRWRSHFLTTMRPKFMPEGWTVDYPVVMH